MHEEFFYSCKTHKRLLKSKKQWSFGQIYFKKFNKLAVFSNFLEFFLFLFEKFSLLDPDQYVDPDS